MGTLNYDGVDLQRRRHPDFRNASTVSHDFNVNNPHTSNQQRNINAEIVNQFNTSTNSNTAQTYPASNNVKEDNSFNNFNPQRTSQAYNPNYEYQEQTATGQITSSDLRSISSLTRNSQYIPHQYANNSSTLPHASRPLVNNNRYQDTNGAQEFNTKSVSSMSNSNLSSVYSNNINTKLNNQNCQRNPSFQDNQFFNHAANQSNVSVFNPSANINEGYNNQGINPKAQPVTSYSMKTNGSFPISSNNKLPVNNNTQYYNSNNNSNYYSTDHRNFGTNINQSNQFVEPMNMPMHNNNNLVNNTNSFNQTFKSNDAINSNHKVFDPFNSVNQPPADSHDSDDDSVPLLTELGIEPREILRRMIRVIILRKIPDNFVSDIDICNPIINLVCIFVGHLFLRKVYFGFIYALISLSTLMLYSLHYLINHQINLSIYQSLCTLGYGLLPQLVIVTIACFTRRLMIVKIALTIIMNLWSTIICTYIMNSQDRQNTKNRLLIYPLFLFYTAFSLVSIS